MNVLGVVRSVDYFTLVTARWIFNDLKRFTRFYVLKKKRRIFINNIIFIYIGFSWSVRMYTYSLYYLYYVMKTHCLIFVYINSLIPIQLWYCLWSNTVYNVCKDECRRVWILIFNFWYLTTGRFDEWIEFSTRQVLFDEFPNKQTNNHKEVSTLYYSNIPLIVTNILPSYWNLKTRVV